MYKVGLTYNNTCIHSLTNLQKICQLGQKTDSPDKDTVCSCTTCFISKRIIGYSNLNKRHDHIYIDCTLCNIHFRVK